MAPTRTGRLANLALAVYHHDTSRELDPQLHTHAVAANLTYDGTEGRWKALQASEIYERRAYLSEVYRNALAREVRALGYEIENQRDAKGRDSGFEIRGVPKELLAKFSQRSIQRDQAIDAFVEQHGRSPTDNEVAVLVRESRADKLTEISTRELRAKQRARLTPGRREDPDADARRTRPLATAYGFERTCPWSTPRITSSSAYRLPWTMSCSPKPYGMAVDEFG